MCKQSNRERSEEIGPCQGIRKKQKLLELQKLLMSDKSPYGWLTSVTIKTGNKKRPESDTLFLKNNL